MPYQKESDLPESVKSLPFGAKNIFMSAFNSAYSQYKGDEEKAFAVAWAAVKNKYKKEGDSWVAKSVSEENDFTMFLDFSKRDDDQRMVYGYATTAALDSQDEIVEIDATEKAAEDYKMWRNIREMHQPSAVGTAPIVEMKKNGLWIGAKIIDDSAWKKVKEGVYKGFSIGGKKLKAIQDYDLNLNKAITRIKEYLLTEISLVDRPANPLATFSFVKRDLSEVESVKEIKEEVAPQEQVLEKTASTEEVKKDEVVLEKAAAPASEVVEKAVEKTTEETLAKEAVVEAPAVEVAKTETVVEAPKVSEEMVSIKKADYDALLKDKALLKGQQEFLDLLKEKIEKAFAAEEPKELVEKADKKMEKSDLVSWIYK